ncbi:MAG: transporter [Clostridiales bacterium]|nr:transporter [Clostridiales bacterium]MDD7036237.1 transporter [Bacillota bacterium]MDY2920906.1 transporter [Lentihominibacter sp.]
MSKGNSKKKYYILMHCALFMLSFSGVFAKLAAQSEWFTVKWVLLYGMMFLILGIYALVWQRILKGLPLTVAFSNKAVTLFWGMVWGAIIFGEHITLRMIIGAAIIFAGIIIISTEETGEEEGKEARLE